MDLSMEIRLYLIGILGPQFDRSVGDLVKVVIEYQAFAIKTSPKDWRLGLIPKATPTARTYLGENRSSAVSTALNEPYCV